MESRPDITIHIILAALFEWRSRYSKALPLITLSVLGFVWYLVSMDGVISLCASLSVLCIICISLGAITILSSWLAVVS